MLRYQRRFCYGVSKTLLLKLFLSLFSLLDYLITLILKGRCIVPYISFRCITNSIQLFDWKTLRTKIRPSCFSLTQIFKWLKTNINWPQIYQTSSYLYLNSTFDLLSLSREFDFSAAKMHQKWFQFLGDLTSPVIYL